MTAIIHLPVDVHNDSEASMVMDSHIVSLFYAFRVAASDTEKAQIFTQMLALAISGLKLPFFIRMEYGFYGRAFELANRYERDLVGIVARRHPETRSQGNGDTSMMTMICPVTWFNPEVIAVAYDALMTYIFPSEYMSEDTFDYARFLPANEQSKEITAVLASWQPSYWVSNPHSAIYSFRAHLPSLVSLDTEIVKRWKQYAKENALAYSDAEFEYWISCGRGESTPRVHTM